VKKHINEGLTFTTNITEINNFPPYRCNGAQLNIQISQGSVATYLK